MEENAKIILASNSERRRNLSEQMKIPYKIIVPNCSEEIPNGIKAEDAPLLLAERKAFSVASVLKENESSLILAADTMIIFDSRAIGKAKNEEEAKKFLKDFSGKCHSVITGVALLNSRSGKLISKKEITKVEFSSMTNSEIDWLVKTEEWKDAAGAYKIQGISGCFIRKIQGSYTNVVGLPISTVYDMLKAQGFNLQYIVRQ